MKVFLSGGTHGAWQDRVVDACPELSFFDPRSVSGITMSEIAAEEREWLNQADLVFVYLEESNPSGLGSAFEMGYAIANRIPIIFVDEKQTSHTEWLGVYAMTRLHDLDDGIALLKSLNGRPPEPGDQQNGKPYVELPVARIGERLTAGDFGVLVNAPLRGETVPMLGGVLREQHPLYERLLLATLAQPRRWYDWNLGNLIPHLNAEWIAEVVERYAGTLTRSEGVAWGLGELGSEDERIINFLFLVCEQCADYDAWWCAGHALEKLRSARAIDLLKRTLRGPEWDDLAFSLANLGTRAALIGVLRQVTAANLEPIVLPALAGALDSENNRIIQNAVWLFERLRVDDDQIRNRLLELFKEQEDASHTLAPRIVEALGEIASPDTRPLLEVQVRHAKYFRNRAYAAHGLGLIGDERSQPILRNALEHEDDWRVMPHLTDALYAIRDPERRELNVVRRTARWPENGMVADESNEWYANPDVYDRFAQAEDPENLSFAYAMRLIPRNRGVVVDLGTGTGRFATFLGRERSDIAKICAFDANHRMVDFFRDRIRLSGDGDHLEVAKAENAALPLADSSVDAVVSSWAFPSKLWDLQVCADEVREVIRVLKPRGVLITIGWDETFQDELSELWFKYVPEPTFRRETLEEWRRRRRARIRSPRNSHLTFETRNLRVPVKFETVKEAAYVMGHLFGFGAGEDVMQARRREFSILVGITRDTRGTLKRALRQIEAEIREADPSELDAGLVASTA